VELTLHINICADSSPELQSALANLLSALGHSEEAEQTGAQVKQTPAGNTPVKLIGIEEVVAFIKSEQPEGNTKKILTDAKRFYNSLIRWAEEGKLSLEFLCPNTGCNAKLGQCRCQEFGSWSDSGRWIIWLIPATAASWKLSLESILGLSAKEIRSVPKLTSHRLRQFIFYLRRTTQS